jgi:hypothetical protein
MKWLGSGARVVADAVYELDPAHDQVRRGPTTVTDFEVNLSDMCVKGNIVCCN